MFKIATLVGTRSPPNDISHLANTIGSILSNNGCINRTGGAIGMDSDFAKLYNISLIENYRHKSDQIGCINVFELDNIDIAIELISQIVPHYDFLSEEDKQLHIRNCYQVLGKDLKTPSDVLICYCKVIGGKPIGGTATAITLARKHNIKIYNLYFEKDKKYICELLKIPYINPNNNLSSFFD